MQNSALNFIIIAWINFIIVVVPPKLKATFTELLIGAILARSGHVTKALLAVGFGKHYSTYFRMISEGKWSWLKVTRQLARLVMKCFPRVQWTFVIDDFICPRASKKAPQVKYHHDHAKKPNRPKYIWGQQWVTLGLSVTWGKMCICLPILPRLHKSTGNRTKLTTAVALIRAVLPEFKQQAKVKLRCLVDAWYVKAPFILPMLARGIHVIGQCRIDAALFFDPIFVPNKKGAPRKYGQKITEILRNQLPLRSALLNVYGGPKLVKYRSTECLARFLKGQRIVAVWCQLPEQKNWTLILSTDLTLTPEQIIKFYARRWKIEPMFNEVKHAYGIGSAWQQDAQSLHRWVTMLCVAYSLTRMLSAILQNKAGKSLVPIIPWRNPKIVTAGMVAIGLKIFFRHFSFGRLWNPKSKKLILENQDNFNPKL